MSSAKDLQQRVAYIANTITSEANALLREDRYKDALARLTDGAKELRVVRAEIIVIERQIRAAAQEQRRKIAHSGQLVGLVGGSKVRSATARGRQASRRKLADKQADALDPYRTVKDNIDVALSQIEAAKLQVKAAADQAAPAEPTRPAPAPTRTAPPVAPPPPPQWAPDPTGRHESRYWDGAQWTTHVADRGVAAIDPI